MSEQENMLLQGRIMKLTDDIARAEKTLARLDAAMESVRADLEGLAQTRERLSKILTFQKTTLAMVDPGPAFLDAQSSH